MKGAKASLMLWSHYLNKHLKALVFLHVFEESVDCNLLLPFYDDSNLHISLFKCVLSTMGGSKESISKLLSLHCQESRRS